MRLIMLVTQTEHVPKVHRWDGQSWKKVEKMYQESEREKEQSYFMFDGESTSTYMVQTGWGCDGTTFLDGKGDVLTRIEAGQRIGTGMSKVVMIP